MALPTQLMLLCIVVTVMAAAIPGITGSYYFENCSLDPAESTSGPAFRANLKSALHDLPVAVAAASTGFAAQRSGLDPDAAFARGLCIGDPPSPQQCLGCLQSIVDGMTADEYQLCDGTTLRAGYWDDDCALAYADTNTSSAGEEAFHMLRFSVGVRRPTERLYELQELVDVAMPLSLLPHDAIAGSGATASTTTGRGASTVRALARCAGDRTEGDCTRCLQDSARYLGECPANGDMTCGLLDGTFAGNASVLQYNCYLRLEISPPTGKGESLRLFFLHQLVGLVVYATMM